MANIKLDLKALDLTFDTDHCDVDRPVSYSFPLLKKKNVAIQAIIQGSLLADIELEAIPEYGIVFSGSELGS
ncbi:MAG: hypothetical protein ABJL55_02725 [Roseibium sp.]